MEKYFDNRNIIQLIVKWKYHLAVITIIAALLAVVFSSPWVITPLFKSVAVVYPHNINSYSEESETEQMLQLIQSRDIKDSVIKKFDLARHYEIDSTYKYFYTTLLWEFDQRVSISKTMYESVEIEVMDKDPQMAANIVQAIIDFYNKKVRKIHNEKWLEVVKIYGTQLTSKKQYMDSLRVIMRDLGKNYGLYEYESQSEEITKGLLKTVMGSAQVNTREVENLNESMKEKGGELVTVVELLRNEARTYADVKLEYEQASRFYTDKMTYINVVTPPFPSDKKSYPIRWLIVVVTVIATFFLALIIILVIENYKSFLKSRPVNTNPENEPVGKKE